MAKVKKLTEDEQQDWYDRQQAEREVTHLSDEVLDEIKDLMAGMTEEDERMDLRRQLEEQQRDS